MKNADALTMLNELGDYLDKGQYKEASNYIERKKAEIKNKIDPSSEYMDKLIKELK